MAASLAARKDCFRPMDQQNGSETVRESLTNVQGASDGSPIGAI
jgi:hypothetical protein